MAPCSDSSILVPVFFDGMLPRYGFCRCVACALGVVVPSAGLIGRGVATEYPSGLRLCPGAGTVDARMNAALSTRDRFRLFRLVSLVIGLPFCAVGLPMRPFGRIFRRAIFRPLLRPFGLPEHQYGWSDTIRRDRTVSSD